MSVCSAPWQAVKAWDVSTFSWKRAGLELPVWQCCQGSHTHLSCQAGLGAQSPHSLLGTPKSFGFLCTSLEGSYLPDSNTVWLKGCAICTSPQWKHQKQRLLEGFVLCSSVLGLDSMGSSLILPDHSLKAPLTPSRQRAGCLTARGLEEQKKKKCLQRWNVYCSLMFSPNADWQDPLVNRNRHREDSKEYLCLFQEGSQSQSWVMYRWHRVKKQERGRW